MKKKYCIQIILILIFLIEYSYAFALENLSNSQTLIYTNQSILKCGPDPTFKVYSAFDIKLLLILSNSISSHKINLLIDWNHFYPPAINSTSINDDQIQNLPPEIERILFLCLTREESERLNLYNVSNNVIDEAYNRIMIEKPWQNDDLLFKQKVESLDEQTLKMFIQIILSANLFETNRGDLIKNKSILYINWDWLTALGFDNYDPSKS